MSLVVNTNVASLIAQHRLDISNRTLQQSMERLSSGYRINRASDDAAGLTISQNLASQIRRMKQSLRNTDDGVSVLQVTEGALSVMGDDLQRVRELTVQAASDTNSTGSRAAISTEIQALLQDIDRIAKATNFNGINTLDGTFDPASPQYNPTMPKATIQVGPNSNATTNVVDITPVLTDSTSNGLKIVGGAATFASIALINLTDNTTSLKFLADVDTAMGQINTQRANIGSYQNKLESVSSNLDMAIENFSTSNSRIRDVDVASESANMVQSQILTQAATSVLAQTNQLPQMILRLLQQ